MIRPKTDIMKVSENGLITEEALLGYVNNTLSAVERQELETLLKDDVFAQEALEGMLAVQDGNAVRNTVVGLKRKIRETTGLKESKGASIHWVTYAWAAALVGLLVGIGFIIITYTSKNNNQLAMQAEAPTAEQKLLEATPDKTRLESAETETVSDSANAAVSIPTSSTPALPDVKPLNKTNTNIDEAKPYSKEHALTTVAPVASRNAEAGNVAPSRTDTKTETITPPAAKIMTATNAAEQSTVAVPVTIENAMKSFNSGDYKTASGLFDKILSKEPDNSAALYFGGISDYINSDAKKGEKNFDKLLKKGDSYIDGSKWYKANILLKKGRKEEAKKLLNELAESNGSYKERAVKKKTELGY